MVSETIVKNYYTERLSTSNLKDLYTLYLAVYQKQKQEGYFERKYDTTYTGCAYIGFIAYNEDKTPVGFYGVQPCFINYQNKRYLAAQSGDTMTHPGFRLHGLFIELSQRTFSLSREEGIEFLFGFPNQNSYHGAVKHLGWKMTDTLQCYTWEVSSLPIKKFAERLHFLKDTYKRYKERLLKKYECVAPGLENSLLNEGFGGIDRTFFYFMYKTYSRTHVLTLGKAHVWISIQDSLLVGDIALNEEKVETVISRLKQLAFKLGIRKIFFHTGTGTLLNQALVQKYPAQPSFPVLFQDLGTDLPLEQIKFTLADIDIF